VTAKKPQPGYWDGLVLFQGSWADGRRGGGQQSTAGRTAPNTSLEPLWGLSRAESVL